MKLDPVRGDVFVAQGVSPGSVVENECARPSGREGTRSKAKSQKKNDPRPSPTIQRRFYPGKISAFPSPHGETLPYKNSISHLRNALFFPGIADESDGWHRRSVSPPIARRQKLPPRVRCRSPRRIPHARRRTRSAVCLGGFRFGARGRQRASAAFGRTASF